VRDGTNGIDGENREDREDREDREFKELRERLSLNSLNSLNSLISYFNQHTDFSLEVPRFVTKSKLHWKGVYLMYISFQGNELGGEDWGLSREIICCQKGLGLVYHKRRSPRDSTQTYSPRGLTFSDGPRMTPYHNKLHVD
jgi:hypothetical protein